jgi:glycosyltransferase involved in cell wall biosynthesis
LKVYLLTNSVAFDTHPLLRCLHNELNELLIFVGTATERGRDWTAEWGDLPVRVQKCWTYTGLRHFGALAKELYQRQIPYDTIPLLLRERPDVVISTDLGFRTMQAALYRKLFANSRLIIWSGLSQHTEQNLPWWRTYQRKMLYRAADAASANGFSAKAYLLGLDVPGRKIFTLPYCFDLTSYLNLPLTREPDAVRRFLFVGGLIERKGLIPFLVVLSRWFQQHNDEKGELWIAGDGPLRRQVEEFPVPPRLRVTFLGNIAHENLPAIYAQAGILVFPTLADEWGLVVNEALSAGLPILGSLYSQAVEELVREGETGWTFHPDRPSQVEHAVEQAMLTPSPQLAAMRGNCRQAVTHLTPSCGANQLLRAIHFVQTGEWEDVHDGGPVTHADYCEGSPIAQDYRA